MKEMRRKQHRSVKTMNDKIDTLEYIAFRLMRCLCINSICAECPAYRPDAEINDRCDVIKINKLIMEIQDIILKE